jgi:glycosyltransferase involved in cell wall biosynthesis
MQETVFISIITINLNNATGLGKTLKSIINQSYKNLEIIVIDGNSNDGSITVIKENEKHLKYWSSESDTGIYNAMNKGIQKAIGEYCLFLNSGDYFADEYVLEKIANENISHCFISGNLLIGRNGKVLQVHKGIETLTFMDLYLSKIKHQSTFIRRDVFDKYGLYDETLKIIADWAFFIQCIGLHNESYKFTDIDIAFFDESGISNNPKYFELIAEERNIVLNKIMNPLIEKDYKRFLKLLFIEKANEYQLFRFFLKIMAKLLKIYTKINPIL